MSLMFRSDKSLSTTNGHSLKENLFFEKLWPMPQFFIERVFFKTVPDACGR
jgi:hypothetical protein